MIAVTEMALFVEAAQLEDEAVEMAEENLRLAYDARERAFLALCRQVPKSRDEASAKAAFLRGRGGDIGGQRIRALADSIEAQWPEGGRA
jgi:hypothetical protein